MTAKTTKTTKPDTFTASQIMVQHGAFDHAIKSAELAANIRAAGVADERTRRAYIIGRVARGLLATQKAAAEFIGLSDNERKAREADLLRDAGAIVAMLSYVDPAKAGDKAAEIRRQMREGKRRNKTQHALEGAARAHWSRFCRDHGLAQKSAKAGNVNQSKAKTGRPAGQKQGHASEHKAGGGRMASDKATLQAIRAGAVPARELAPSFTNGGEVLAWLDREASVMRLILDKTPKHVDNLQRAVMREFVDAVAALHGDAS